MEAKQRRLAFCILTENDLESSDQRIRQLIEEARTDWKRRAFDGGSHGFLIVAISPAIANARQGSDLQALAMKICELYVGAGATNEIHHDSLILDIDRPGQSPERRSWKVGVNYFSAQGDGRWWSDHRIPGGMAFSMNSVGHMARAKVESELAKNSTLANRLAELPREKLVYWALPKAMKTIGPPVDGSDRGTWLADRGAFAEDSVPPTFEQRQRYFAELAKFSENRYKGRYHTDHTIPSDYFREDLWKLEDITVRDDLYFTYLHYRADTDYESMGLGDAIGQFDESPLNSPVPEQETK